MVLIQTTLEPENLQVVLNEAVTRRSVFVSDIIVQKPVIGSNGNGNREHINAGLFVPPEEVEVLETKSEPYTPPTEPLVCNIGGS